MTDLPSIHRVGPTRNRTIGNPHCFTLRRTRRNAARETSARGVSAVHDGTLVWSASPLGTSASDIAGFAATPGYRGAKRRCFLLRLHMGPSQKRSERTRPEEVADK